MTRTEAIRYRGIIEAAAQSLDDDTALTAVCLHPVWVENTTYTVGYKVRYGGKLWRCLQNHTAQDDWNPDTAPSLWARVLIPDATVIPQWEQPDSTNSYMTGDKVTHNGRNWVSNVDNNVWEPGICGWTEV